MRHEDAFLTGFRHFGPEHAIENVGMRLHQDAGLVHLLFLDAQNLTERVHLPAHVLHHLVHGVYFDLAFLVTLESKANRHVLSRFHQQRLIILIRGTGLR